MILYSKIEGSGKPLLILHGFLGMSDNWKTLGSQYSADGFEVHMIDLRNHGRSFHSEEFTYQAMADDILQYCNHHGLKEIFLMGHSMGGKVAMLFAAQHPEYVSKLIVADIGPQSYRPHHDEILQALASVDFKKVDQRQDVDELLSSGVPDLGTRQFLMKSLYWKEPGKLAYRFNLDAFLKNRDIIGDALPENATFDKPTMFISGENSKYVESEDHPLIKTHFPDVRFEVIKNAGHWLHAENPKDYFASTTAFLKA